MNQELSVNLRCVVMRSGFFLWMEEEKAEKLKSVLMQGNKSAFIEIDGRVINVVDIIGIFGSDEMDDYFRLKRGQWKCIYGDWHERNGECNCLEYIQIEEHQKEESKKWAEIRENEISGKLVSPETVNQVRQTLINKMVIKK